MAHSKKLRDQVRDVIRLKHYSIHTEESYVDWIKHYSWPSYSIGVDSGSWSACVCA